VTRTEAGESLFGAAIPLEPVPQWLARRIEFELDSLGVRNADEQAGVSITVKLQYQLDPIGIAADQLRPQRALGGKAILARHHAFGELHEMVVDRAVGDPRACRAKQYVPAATQGNGEWTQRHLDPHGSVVENDALSACGDRGRTHRHSIVLQR
jgi:hypothetical protein